MSSVTVPLLDDDTIPFGEEEELSDKPPSKYTHPYIVFFHLFFRVLAIVVYMFCTWFSDSFITSFVVVILLLSADFWTVKNITGRLLVGLRWWNYVDDEGESHWVYESKQKNINSHESRIFWLGLILCPAFWCLLFITAFFSLSFKWLIVVVIALSLNFANLYGYIKCNFGASTNFNSAATNFLKAQIFKNAVDIITKPSSQATASKPTSII